MKKAVIIVMAIICPLITYSQSSKKMIGLQITPTVTALRGNTFINDYDPRISFSSGLTFEYPIKKRFSLKSGLAFERKGSGTDILLVDETSQLIGNQKMIFNYDYLVLPIQASHTTTGKTKIYVSAGPYFGFLLSNKTIFGAVGDIPEIISNGTKNSKRIDLGLSLGLGLYIPLNEKLLLDFGLQGNLGLLNTSKTAVINNGSIRTNSFGIMAGLKYVIR